MPQVCNLMMLTWRTYGTLELAQHHWSTEILCLTAHLPWFLQVAYPLPFISPAVGKGIRVGIFQERRLGFIIPFSFPQQTSRAIYLAFPYGYLL